MESKEVKNIKAIQSLPASPHLEETGTPGLTTREYFAIQILNGLICRGEIYAIETAVIMADKLIEKLNEG